MAGQRDRTTNVTGAHDVPDEVHVAARLWTTADGWEARYGATIRPIGSFGEMPGAALGGILTLDLLVHGWDLARATGQPASFDTDLTTQVLGFAEQAIQPEMRDGGLVGPVVTVSATAPVMDRLVGHMGRQP